MWRDGLRRIVTLFWDFFALRVLEKIFLCKTGGHWCCCVWHCTMRTRYALKDKLRRGFLKCVHMNIIILGSWIRFSNVWLFTCISIRQLEKLISKNLHIRKQEQKDWKSFEYLCIPFDQKNGLVLEKNQSPICFLKATYLKKNWLNL